MAKKTEDMAMTLNNESLVKTEDELLVASGDVQGTSERPKSLDSSTAGTEGITIDEIKLSRLAVAQGLSPQVIPSKGKFIKGLSLGEMFNDVTEEIYGNGPLTVVPIMRKVTRIEFDPDDKNRPIDRNVPAGDPRLKWDGDNPPRATEFQEFACLLLKPGKRPEKVVVSIKTTNKEMREAARLWNSYITAREAAIYSGLYKITTTIITGKNKKGEETAYGVFIVKNAGFIPKDTPSGQVLFNYAKNLHESWEGKALDVERVAVDDEDEDDTSFDPAAIEAGQ